jgi:hypothetical protein
VTIEEVTVAASALAALGGRGHHEAVAVFEALTGTASDSGERPAAGIVFDPAHALLTPARLQPPAISSAESPCLRREGPAAVRAARLRHRLAGPGVNFPPDRWRCYLPARTTTTPTTATTATDATSRRAATYGSRSLWRIRVS